MIHVHIGGAGMMIGDMLWRLYDVEKPDMDSKEQIYYETQKGYMPRTIFTDLDKRMNTQQFKDKNYITEFGNCVSACTYSCAQYLEGRDIVWSVQEKIRKLAEGCDKVNEFIFTCAISGGTGSGFSSLVSNRLNIDYPKQSKQIFYIFPSPQMNNNIIYTYNTLLAFRDFLDQFTAQVLFDNQGMYKMLDANIELDTIDYSHLNNLVSQTISAYTSIPRFNKKSNSEIFKTLIPHPRLSILTPSHGPLVSTNDYKRSYSTIRQQQKYIFSPDAQLFYNNLQPNYISSSLISRGLNQDIFLKQSNKIFNKIHTYGQDTNLFISNSRNYQVIEELAPLPLTNTLFANDSSIITRLNLITKQFDQLYAKRAFTHYYTGDGLENSEFRDGREQIQALIQHYGEAKQHEQSSNNDSAIEINYDDDF